MSLFSSDNCMEKGLCRPDLIRRLEDLASLCFVLELPADSGKCVKVLKAPCRPVLREYVYLCFSIT